LRITVLPKGFEIEVYTGTPLGRIVGLSDVITANLPNYVREPDSRNVEYITDPTQCYDRALCDIISPRLKLRQYLKGLGDYSLVPGSTLSLGDSHRFYRSDPTHPYHDYIEATYGTHVVTASIHINIGIENTEDLIRACRLIRLEAPLFLALSASSPFLDGKATGFHSTRWGIFPKTPRHVPLFASHAHFIAWTDAQLKAGTMQNVRHLWSSVRPNGANRPFDLNRLELRICDLVTSPLDLLAITALLEARIQMVLDDPTLDPLALGQSQFDPDELVALTDRNEEAVSRQSLDAQLHHWQDGRLLSARDWIEDLYETVEPTAQRQGYGSFLAALPQILAQGNQAQRWLKLHQEGYSVQSILIQAIAAMAQEELEVQDKLCQPMPMCG
jgi:predicted glutamate--cysteine ligase